MEQRVEVWAWQWTLDIRESKRRSSTYMEVKKDKELRGERRDESIEFEIVGM